MGPMTSRSASRPGDRSGSDLASELLAWDDARLADLLAARPDLGIPAPSSITAMATRATSRPSVGRTLGQLDRPTLTVGEALAVTSDHERATSVDALTRALGFDTGPAVQTLLDLALAVGTPEQIHAVPAVGEALSVHPLGLGPSLRALGLDRADGWPTTTAAVRAVMATAPEGAVRMLQALTWGPPVGTLSADLPPAAQWLVQAKILHPLSATQLILPREVGMALRAGRLATDIPTEPPLPDVPHRDRATVAAESTRAAEDLLHGIVFLLRRWGVDPPAVLRSGGLGARGLRHFADELHVPAGRAALIIETAGMLSLIGQHRSQDGSVWAPTPTAQDWAGEPVADRWAHLVHRWLDCARTPWLVGTRSDKGALRSALEPGLERSWAPDLRRRVLTTLAAWQPGAAPDVADVHAHLAWHTPRAAPPATTVEAVLDELTGLGLLGAGALTEPGRALAAGAGEAELQAAFTADLPGEVGELFIQADLTGIVPGRPSTDLAELLEATAEIEGRGTATTVRFTTDSVRGALDAGLDADQVLARLADYARTGIPQPLEYLIHDTARSHGRIRIAAAAAVLHSSDEGALTALVADITLHHLGLRLIAPTVLLARAGAAEVAEALRESGHSAVLEGPDGQVVTIAARSVRAGHALPAPSTRTSLRQDQPARESLVAQMRAGEARVQELMSRDGGAAKDPVQALETLRAAAETGTEVDLVVAGPTGHSETRLVRPLSVDGGRVRVLDVRRGAEITVAPHRIASVRVASATG